MSRPTRPAVTLSALLLLVSLTGIALTGCKSEGKMSKDEMSNFKGGPMPPEAAKQLEEAQKKAAAEANAPK